ncbi:MAG: ABC transporter permease [Prolixibacteraceae bacterium]|nr:ABC transporter permease [Prolixibacteraceae bacterium]MBN2773834.1 ABC transporter permease [Prolixibacteraceae bacterium]
MNVELFIAKRLFFDKKSQHFVSAKIINIALFSIALSLVTMIISVSVITGFKQEVRNKAIGFGGHIRIINYDTNLSAETRPVSRNQDFLPVLNKLSFIKHIQVFATKPGIIKTEENIEGVVLKGVDTDYNWDFFTKYLVKGSIPEINDSTRTDQVLISEKTSDLMGFDVGDDIYVYFINEDREIPNTRQFKVRGIFNTGLEEFDRLFVIGDIKQIQRLNQWNSDQVSGFEIIIRNFKDLDYAEYRVREEVVNYYEDNGETLRTESIIRKYPQIFDWLSLLDMNVWIILILMTLVAGINMISGLLILMLERSTMIGILKSLGSPDHSIIKVFLYLSGFLVSRGLLWGNLIGIAIIIIQNSFKVLHLDATSYYVSYVPMNFSVIHLIILNIGTLTAVLLMLLLPGKVISKISPEKTIRFD